MILDCDPKLAAGDARCAGELGPNLSCILARVEFDSLRLSRLQRFDHLEEFSVSSERALPRRCRRTVCISDMGTVLILNE